MIAVDEGAHLDTRPVRTFFLPTANPKKDRLMKSDFHHKRRWLPSMLLALALIAVPLSSCEDEEPLCVGYYITVGTKSATDTYIPHDEKVYLITHVMQESIRTVYPKPNKTGDDKAVLVACTKVYTKYRAEHPEFFNGYTVARLHRGWMSGTVIKSSSVIAMWSF